MAHKKYDVVHGDVKTYIVNYTKAAEELNHIRYLFKHWVQYKIIYNDQINTVLNGPYEGRNAHVKVNKAIKTILTHPKCISASRVSELA